MEQYRAQIPSTGGRRKRCKPPRGLFRDGISRLVLPSTQPHRGLLRNRPNVGPMSGHNCLFLSGAMGKEKLLREIRRQKRVLLREGVIL